MLVMHLTDMLYSLLKRFRNAYVMIQGD